MSQRATDRPPISSFLLNAKGKKVAYGVGCAWLGRKGSEIAPEEVDLLHRAWDGGFRYFDTSSAYGESERCLGAFLREVPRQEVFLATKTHIRPDLGPDQIPQRVARSLERLGVECIDLMQIHDISSEAGLFDEASLNRAKEVFAGLKASGTVRFFGLATRSIELQLQGVDSGLFDAHLTYSDLTPLACAAIPLLEKTRQTGAALINGSPLAGGLLAGGDPGQVAVHPTREGRKRKAIDFYELCRKFGVSTLAAALQFPLRFPGVDINLTGPARTEEIESTLAALETPVPEALWNEWPVSQEEPELESAN